MNPFVPIVFGVLAAAAVITVVIGMSFHGNQQSKKGREEEQRRKEKEKEEKPREREREREEERRSDREREEERSRQLDQYSRMAAGVETSMTDRPQLPCYKMDSAPRGLCLIINNRNFDDATKNREWSEIDEKALTELFRDDLSFTVLVERDLRGRQMLDKATQLSQTDHSKYDAFVFIIMSHGGERDAVCGVDGESIGLELLMSQFTATNCRSLENKPKLFFIQACRGNRQERSSPIRSDFYRDAVRYRHRYRHQHLSDSTLPRSVSPIEADFLLFFATAPGYQAFRKERCGSPFIQVLVKTIREYRRHYPLANILPRVIELVVKEEEGIQVPNPTHTLRKEVWL